MAAKKVKIRAKMKNGMAQVKALMPHPMETGTRRDATSGEVIPAHYIEQVTCSLNGEVILTGHWGPSVSKNPYFSFNVLDAQPGDTINITWVDNLGETSSGEAVLK